MERLKLLYIAPHRIDRSPGQRFRFEQYMSYLNACGFDITYANLVSESDDKILYSNGRTLLKCLIGIKGLFIRLRNIIQANKFDVILVYREAHFLGFTLFEKLLSKSHAALVFDFDDAIWLNDTSLANQKLSWLKSGSKTSKIAALANIVTVGNSYLAEYAKQTASEVMIIPTTIDTNKYKYRKPQETDTLTIGWIGSMTTLKHFISCLPVLRQIKSKYGSKVNFKVIVDVDYKDAELGIVSTKWSKETELEELNKIDIGIMPLPDDDWSRGKCGFKGIQYMSLGIPTVMSPVGVNVDIIDHEQNGFLASTTDEWVDCLSQLIESQQLRQRLGRAGRITVEHRFSVESQKEQVRKSLINAIIRKNLKQ
ncbi:MAG: glycosyltransferase family 4 protein [Salinivirgaceae bacterium]|nr:glycosyltransferase family 4 protein [Salinivirgaceae bacterium]